mgnify:CR=1 FL=1
MMKPPKTISRLLTYSYHECFFSNLDYINSPSSTQFKVTALDESKVIVYERIFKTEQEAKDYIESL